MYITVNHYSAFLFPGTDEHGQSGQLFPPVPAFKCPILLHNFLEITPSWRPADVPRRPRLPTRRLIRFFFPPLSSFTYEQHERYISPHAVIMYFLSNALRTHAFKIQRGTLLRGIQSRCSRLESLSAASDVTSACSVSCPLLLLPLLPSSFLSSFIS